MFGAKIAILGVIRRDLGNTYFGRRRIFSSSGVAIGFRFPFVVCLHVGGGSGDSSSCRL